MSLSNQLVKHLRKERGWSQEQLATISGLSERTIQRIENSGECSLDSKMALASAFGVTPVDLDDQFSSQKFNEEADVNWGSVAALVIVLVTFPILIYLLTSTSGIWEISCLLIVEGLTVILSSATYGFKQTIRFFESTILVVPKTVNTHNYNAMIIQAKLICNNVYLIGFVTSLVYILTTLIHMPDWFAKLNIVLVGAIFPILYAVLLAEFLVRPFKHRMEKQLAETFQASEAELVE